ncbi:MAG: hypothetical protein SFV21_18800 [Rhodospirillaceae bacterium]|nr:hypothetical protein [Rhodospirillaceae bacterium]
MTSTTHRIILATAIVGLALANPAVAQDKKDGDANTLPHCSPRVAELCDKLTSIDAIGADTWKVAAYGSTACINSKTIQTERRKRRDRLEYDERLAKAAKEKGQEHTPWQPLESAADFSARTNSQCDGSYAHYCAEMRREAGTLKDETVRAQTAALVESMCGGQTAEATPAAAAPAAR